MKNLEKVIDINAHIENLKCEVNTENGNAIAKISFDNMGDGDITAIKFHASGYNMFGDVVSINGKNEFFLIIQDINISGNGSAVDLKVKLPEGDIRKLDIVESQICYADGSVATYNGDQSLTFPLEEYDNSEEIAALHKLYNEKAKYKIKEFKQGWICTCGRFNIQDLTKCTLCGKSKFETEKICSEEGMRSLVEKYRISKEEEAKAKAEAEKKANVAKKKRNIIIGIAVMVCIALAYPVGNIIIMSGRTTYSSEEEMKEAVQGLYTYYDDSYGPRYKIKIVEDSITQRWVNLGSDYDMDYDIISWNPKEGTITVSLGDYIVLRNGNIKGMDGYEYKSGGNWSDSDTASLSSSGSYLGEDTGLGANSLE